jgi:hypothetical protein
MGAHRSEIAVSALVGFIATVIAQLSGTPGNAQDSTSNQNQTPSNSTVRIIPPAPDAIGGGNPFQGLGRSDESAPSRRSQFESSSDSSGSSLLPGSAGSSSSGFPSSSSGFPPGSIPGSVNPNVAPDLPPPPSTDPIDLQREKEEKEKELDAQKKAEEKARQNAARPASAAADTPLKKALLQLQLRNYDKSLTLLDEIITTNPKNAEAHYLKAVIFVLTRKYDAAANEYRLVLKNDPSPTLSQKARTGLTKLAR